MSRAGLHMPQIVLIERNKRIFNWDHPRESRKYGLSSGGTKDSGGLGPIGATVRIELPASIQWASHKSSMIGSLIPA